MAGDVAEPSVAFDAIHSTHNQCELCVVIDASGTWRGVEEDFSAERVLSYLAPAVRIYEAVCRLTSFLPLHYLYLAGSVAGTVLPFFPGQFEYSLAKLAMHHCLVSGHERGVGFTISMATLGLVEGTDLSKLGPGTRVTDTLVDPREVAHWALERINNPEGTEWYKTFLGNYQVVVE
ncbi:MAG: hypothetical protein A3H59_02345 [Candidatus Jacksonbacteria bacterium RIFCSPLOWO2_02_FULL_43_9]|nr:MAG: hypothetical protein A3B94_03255 [Candidatus Jacksonbacteria bacterium RIFCSPHIGHO2_02_FULL_43_10]OGY74344.1 MAG: hypothetical protein A3H59_02345 [Candidatus Jacksonbacteria bacterium RIFCSPLOWO2_02_FULL_43_9]